MKVFFTAFLVAVATVSLYAQIGIGTTKVNADAILEISSTNKGLLIPRLTTSQRNAVIESTGPDGLLCYDTDVKALYYYDGSNWHTVGTPPGAIIMWSGSVSDIPQGWALCDGKWYDPKDNSDKGTQSNDRTIQTPDLSGRFIVSYDSVNYPTMNETGGAETVTLTTSQIPAHTHSPGTLGGTAESSLHNHSFVATLNNNNGSTGNPALPQRTEAEPHGGNALTFYTGSDPTSSAVGSTDGSHIHSLNITGSTASTGGSDPHENRPPYYVLAFIMKL